MGFKTKSQFESSHFRGATGNAASQLQSALISDPGHIVPDRQLSSETQKRDALRLIQEALNKLKDAGVFLDLVKIPQDEIDNKRYGKPTEDAVVAFKKKLDIRRPGQQVVDPITGRSTLAQLDDEMMKLEGKKVVPDGPADDDAVFVDVVVNFQGGVNFDAPSIVLNDMSIANYLDKLKSKRRFLPVGIGAAGGKSVSIQKIKRDIDKETGSPRSRRGLLCIHGDSLGGRHALDLAAEFTRSGVQIDFLGLEDAAFNFNDASNDPIVVLQIPKPTNTPIFKVGAIAAKRAINYFQTHGNTAKLAKINLPRSTHIWSSDMFGEEIHGKIEGTKIENVSLNDQINFLPPAGNRFHTEAGGIGRQRDKNDISRLLTRLV